MKMNRLFLVTFAAALASGVAVCQAQELPQMPSPTEQHQWLQQLVGEWSGEFEMYMEPGKPPITAKGTESVRSIGGFWTLGEAKSTVMGMPFQGIMTLGYDPEKKKYVGTWVDSMTSHHWNYQGTVDETGKILTLETKGPCPKRPGELTNFKEVIEVKDKDHKVFTSYVQEENGQWVKGMVAKYRRKN